MGRAIVDRKAVHIRDAATASLRTFPMVRELQRRHGHRTLLSVPLVHEKRALGSITLRKMVVEPFTKRQIELVQTFANQAAIAIENARLFNETREALEQQTATAEILKVISSSPTDIQPVFDAVLENATRLCDAHMGILGLYDGEIYRTAAYRGARAEYADWLNKRGPHVPDPATVIGRMIASRKPWHEPDRVSARRHCSSPGRRRRKSLRVIAEFTIDLPATVRSSGSMVIHGWSCVCIYDR